MTGGLLELPSCQDDMTHIFRPIGWNALGLAQLAVIRQNRTNKGMNLPAKGLLAVLHLQTVIDHVRSNAPDARMLTARHEPEPSDPTHSGIYGYTADDQLIADLVAQAVQEVYKAQG